MTTWEYHGYLCEKAHGDRPVEIMNRFGKDGWEAFVVEHHQPGSMRIYFKRPKPDPQGGMHGSNVDTAAQRERPTEPASPATDPA